MDQDKRVRIIKINNSIAYSAFESIIALSISGKYHVRFFRSKNPNASWGSLFAGALLSHRTGTMPRDVLSFTKKLNHATLSERLFLFVAPYSPMMTGYPLSENFN